MNDLKLQGRCCTVTEVGGSAAQPVVVCVTVSAFFCVHFISVLTNMVPRLGNSNLLISVSPFSHTFHLLYRSRDTPGHFAGLTLPGDIIIQKGCI